MFCEQMAEPTPDKKGPVRASEPSASAAKKDSVRAPAKWAKDLADWAANPRDSKYLLAECRGFIKQAVMKNSGAKSWKFSIMANIHCDVQTLEDVLKQICGEMNGSGLTIDFKSSTSRRSIGQVQVTISKDGAK